MVIGNWGGQALPLCSAPFPTIQAFFSMTDAPDTPDTIQEPRCWSDGRWTAQVIKNEDDDGWAVAMTLKGEAEPALVGPWTMGRDKKNPKPLDVSAFHTLVKTASEVVRRHEQQLHAQLNKSVTSPPPTASACAWRWPSCPMKKGPRPL